MYHSNPYSWHTSHPAHSRSRRVACPDRPDCLDCADPMISWYGIRRMSSGAWAQQLSRFNGEASNSQDLPSTFLKRATLASYTKHFLGFMDLTTKMECDVVLLLVLLMLLVLSAFLYAGARSSVSGRLSEDLALETCHTEVAAAALTLTKAPWWRQTSHNSKPAWPTNQLSLREWVGRRKEIKTLKTFGLQVDSESKPEYVWIRLQCPVHSMKFFREDLPLTSERICPLHLSAASDSSQVIR